MESSPGRRLPRPPTMHEGRPRAFLRIRRMPLRPASAPRSRPICELKNRRFQWTITGEWMPCPVFFPIDARMRGDTNDERSCRVPKRGMIFTETQRFFLDAGRPGRFTASDRPCGAGKHWRWWASRGVERAPWAGAERRPASNLRVRALQGKWTWNGSVRRGRRDARNISHGLPDSPRAEPQHSGHARACWSRWRRSGSRRPDAPSRSRHGTARKRRAAEEIGLRHPREPPRRRSAAHARAGHGSGAPDLLFVRSWSLGTSHPGPTLRLLHPGGRKSGSPVSSSLTIWASCAISTTPSASSTECFTLRGRGHRSAPRPPCIPTTIPDSIPSMNPGDRGNDPLPSTPPSQPAPEERCPSPAVLSAVHPIALPAYARAHGA